MESDDTAMEDVDSRKPVAPSLDRLKNLDSLTSLEAQLQVAEQLCNHGHRAEMILRWLISKSQQERTARQNVEAWHLLTKCFRLVAPQRVSFLLGRSDFLGLVQKALDDMPVNDMCRDKPFLLILTAMEQSLSTLMEISNGPDGALVKRVLCTGEVRAANLLGSWIGQLCNSMEGEPLTSIVNDTVRTVTFIWRCRNSGSTEDDSFARYCLLPCTRLMYDLHFTRMTAISPKRKRGTGSESYPLHEMELLIARHLFLPARTAFSRARSNGKSEDQADLFASKVKVLKLAVDINDNGTQELDCDAVTILLDIAIRCVPMTTSKQRAAELPWVEFVFHALLDCIAIDRDPYLRSNEALIDMLDVVQKRASLSTITLRKLAEQYSFLHESAATSGEKTNYMVVAKVIELDANVYVEDAMATQLFSGLTDTSNFMTKISRTTEGVQRWWQDSIIAPLLKAFASNRKLDDFVQRWYGQLRRGEKEWTWTIWNDVKLPLADILELNVPAEKLEKLFDTLHAGLKPGNTAAADMTSIRSSSVVLLSLLQGVRSDQLRERLQPRLAALYKDLLALFEGETSMIPSRQAAAASSIPQTWRLLARTFQLWFPTFNAQLPAPAEAAHHVNDLFTPAVLDAALRYVGRKDEGNANSGAANAWHHDSSVVEYWLGQVCSTLSGYEKCRGSAVKILEQLLAKPQSAVPEAFIAFPDLLSLLQPGSRQQMLNDAVQDLCDSKEATPNRRKLKTQLASLAQSCTASSNPTLAEELVEALLRPIKGAIAGKGAQGQPDAILELLTTFPMSMLARSQRERVLNALTEVASLKHRDQQQNTRLMAVVTTMLALPAPSAQICADAATIWSIGAMCRPVEGKRRTKSPAAPLWNATALSLLDDLARLVASHLLSAQEQERSRTVLKDLHAASTGVIENGKFKAGSVSLDRVVIASAVIRTLHHGANKDTLMAMTGSTEIVSSDHLERFAKQCQKAGEIFSSDSVTEQTDLELSTMLDLLAAMSDSIDTKDAATEKSLGKVVNAVLPLAKSLKESGVQAVRILPRGKSSAGDIAPNISLLAAGLSAGQKYSVLQTTRKHLALMAAPERAAFLEDSKSRLTTASLEEFTILQQALHSVSKSALDDTGSEISHDFLPSLLTVLSRRPDYATYAAAFPSILTIVRDKPFLVTQHTLESTLVTIDHYATLIGPASTLIFLDLTNLLSALLTHHRARLQNRLHLLLPVLQALLARLFTPNKVAAAARKALTARHARAFTRLITLLCNPPTHRSRKNTTGSAGLVDEARRARACVGQFVPSLLHSFSCLQLSGTLGEGMREALTPGLWAIIECIEIRGPESIKALSAAMNGSERAILRGVYEDWKRFGKWDGA